MAVALLPARATCTLLTTTTSLAPLAALAAIALLHHGLRLTRALRHDYAACRAHGQLVDDLLELLDGVLELKGREEA